MGLLVQVGNPSDMPKIPKHFPKCGNWKYSGYEEESEKDDEEKVCVNAVPSIMTPALLILIIINACIVKLFFFE